MLLSAIENELVTMLVNKGPIVGTAQVAYALWPNRDIKAQGAAVAVGGILRRVQELGFVDKTNDKNSARYEVTMAGRAALLSDANEANAQEANQVERKAGEVERAKEIVKARKIKQAAVSNAWIDKLKKNDGWRLVLDLDAECAKELRELVEAGFGSQARVGRKTARAAVQQAIHEAFKKHVESE